MPGKNTPLPGGRDRQPDFAPRLMEKLLADIHRAVAEHGLETPREINEFVQAKQAASEL